MSGPSIFQFTNLEAYLGRYYLHKKGLNPSFSYALWAKKMGVRSPATLCMVVKGQRSPGKNLVLKLKKNMALTAEESRYFEILIQLKKRKSDTLASPDLVRELEKRHPHQGFSLVEQDQFRMISNWYSWALLEMVALKNFKEDPHWISKVLQYEVSESEIREALSVLERINLIGRNRNGRLVRTSQPLVTANDKADEAIQEFHNQGLKNAQASLHKHSVQERHFESLTISLSSEKMGEAKKFIGDFVEEFLRRFDSPDSDKVQQMQVSLIPLTEKLNDSKKVKVNRS